MDVQKVHNFFFHPLARGHTPAIKALSIATVIALSVITLSGFLILFGIINIRDRCFKPNAQNPKVTNVTGPRFPPDQNKLNHLKQKHSEQLQSFEKWAKNTDWKMFKPEHSHYDWWTFPISRASSGQGTTYSVNKQEIEALKTDPVFMKNYRRGVELVVQSWGWDLQNDRPIAPSDRTKDQEWTGYGVRLGKMADSLFLFNEKELYNKLKMFFRHINNPPYPKLDGWVVETLSRTL